MKACTSPPGRFARAGTTRRLLEPHGLLVRPPLWYVIAWDRDRHALRLFRADGISRSEVTDRTFARRPNDLVTGVCLDGRAEMSSHGQRATV